MKLAIKRFVAVSALSLGLVGHAMAEVTAEVVEGFAGNVSGTIVEAGKAQPAPRVAATQVVYDNSTSTALYAVSSTDLNSTWGDRCTTTGTGILNEHIFSLFNSGSSGGGPLLTATVQVTFFDAVTTLSLGGYSTNINFGVGGLPTGFFATVTVPNLDPLLINLNVTDIIMTQKVTAKTGTANRLGIVSFDPPTVGSSAASMYISSATIGGGVPGFYTFSNGPANPGYKVTVTTPTVGVEPATWSAMKGLFQ
jgi:hypothetical protein